MAIGIKYNYSENSFKNRIQMEQKYKSKNKLLIKKKIKVGFKKL